MGSIEVKPTPKVESGDTIMDSPRQEDVASQAILDMNDRVEEKSVLYRRTNELVSRLGVLFKFLGPVSEVSLKNWSCSLYRY